jgi:hypothetical protein
MPQRLIRNCYRDSALGKKTRQRKDDREQHVCAMVRNGRDLVLQWIGEKLADGLARTRRRTGENLPTDRRELADGSARTCRRIGENSPTRRRLAVKYAHRARELGSTTLAAVRHVLDVIGMKSGLERPHHQTPAASRTRQHQTRQARFSYDLAVHGKSPPPCARAGERANPLQASSYVVHPTPRNRLRVRLPPQFRLPRTGLGEAQVRCSARRPDHHDRTDCAGFRSEPWSRRRR